MQLIYAPEPSPESFSKSIFLAGPTPRNQEVESWRPKAIEELEKQEYDGVVFIPEPRDGIFSTDYEDQVQWEENAMNMSDVILFWIPRDIKSGMPALTTNHEHGEYFKLGKSVLGFPDNADKIRYLEYKAMGHHVPIARKLQYTVRQALEMLSKGEMNQLGRLRKGGERYIPIHIWQNFNFDRWYQNQKRTIEKARLDWIQKDQYSERVRTFAINITLSQGQTISKAEFVFTMNCSIPDIHWEMFEKNIKDTKYAIGE